MTSKDGADAGAMWKAIYPDGRPKERIPKILSLLETVWKRQDQTRLGQLLINLTKQTDIFYVEDDELIALLQIEVHGDVPS